MRPPRPFPQRCPDCRAPRVDAPWQSPITRREYESTVRHRDASCETYRAIERHPADPVAHLLDIGGGRS